MADDEANIIFGAVIDPDIEDEVRVTVIATGFEEKKEKVELPQIKKWMPVKEPITFKGSDRKLAKNLRPEYAVAPAAASDLMPYEDPLDIPTFMRKASQHSL